MKKICLVGLIALMILAVTVSSVQALTVEYNVMPHKGTPDQEILVTVRVDPIVSEDRIKLYLFWDNDLVFEQIFDTALTKTSFRHSWDLHFTPLIEVPDKIETGDHRIEIWLEESDGSIQPLYYNYRIIDGIVSLSSWDKFIEQYPQVLEDLKGDPGDPGLKGDTGGFGMPGIEGIEGPRGDQGIDGIQGDQGVQGIQGEAGRLGVVYLVLMFLINIVVSIITARIARRN